MFLLCFPERFPGCCFNFKINLFQGLPKVHQKLRVIFVVMVSSSNTDLNLKRVSPRSVWLNFCNRNSQVKVLNRTSYEYFID